MMKSKLIALLLAGATMMQGMPMMAKTVVPSHNWITTNWEEPGNWKHLSVDGNSATRWTTNNKGNWIQYDLGNPKTLESIGIELFYPETSQGRLYTYSIQTSLDGKKWDTICSRVVSTGKDEGMVYYPAQADKQVKYVKIIGYGSNQNTWFSLAEVDFKLDSNQLTEEEKQAKLYLSTVESIISGRELEVVVTGSNAKGAYAQDITLTYDEEAFELDKITGLDETQIVKYKSTTPGQIRILSATDKGLGIVDDIYKITFKTKHVPSTKIYTLTAKNGTLGKVKDGESQIVETSPNQIEVLLIKDAMEGIRPGDLNKDGLIDVEDLALVTCYYQAKETDANWLEAKCADSNEDGYIDISDIAFVTSQMIEEILATKK